jgi:hypothetical protein
VVLQYGISIFSAFYFTIISIVSVVSGGFIISKMKVDGELSGFLVYIFSPVLILFGLYTIYRVWNNSTLIKVKTDMSQSQSKQLLIKFLNFRHYEIVLENYDSILVNDENELSYNNLWTKHIWFIIGDQEILFNVQKQYPRLNPPVYLSQILLKNDLKSFIRKEQTN